MTPQLQMSTSGPAYSLCEAREEKWVTTLPVLLCTLGLPKPKTHPRVMENDAELLFVDRAPS